MEFNELTEQIFGLRVGIHWQGGIVVYVDESGKHGLIAAENDLGRTNWNNAIEICREYRDGGFDDWHLPTKYGLSLLYLAHQRGIYRSINSYYWSSSECSATHGWVQHFGDGDHYSGNKRYDFYVRAVRSF